MAVCLLLLAVCILVSGLDDLFIGTVYLWTAREDFPWPGDEELKQAPERRIAILVPLWQEHRVIGRMLDYNLPGIRYSNYEVFVGVYPNDPLTALAVGNAAARHPNVHLAQVAHNGPTSKGDCLNAAWREMQRFERRHGERFDIVVTHDAEDVVHPESLRMISWFSRTYEMVQVPVLPLATGAAMTHGVYCDEFAEYQSKDIPVRQRLNGFVPANGVGTGFDRDALDRLGNLRGGRVFDPDALTEDYETGFQLHALGYRQLFVPVRFDAAGPVATREYFPSTLRAAVRQRSRWVAGIALQGWQRHGWRVPWKQRYWLWRDRKGLVGNLVAPAANLLFLCGAINGPPLPMPPWVLGGMFCLSVAQIALRMKCAARIYGPRFAAGVPVRAVWGNVLNCLATMLALQQFVTAHVKSTGMHWRKTEHAFPDFAPVSHVAREASRTTSGVVLRAVKDR